MASGAGLTLIAANEQDRLLRKAVKFALRPELNDGDTPEWPKAGEAVVGLPVMPLIEMILQYLIPWRGVVTTLLQGLKLPGGVAIHSDTESGVWTTSYLIADTGHGCFRRHYTDRMPCLVVLAGKERKLTYGSSTPSHIANGDSLSEAAFIEPRSICVDPTTPNRFFLSDNYSIRRLEESKRDGGVVSLVAGGAASGAVDGVASAAKFNGITALVATSDGAMLYACDTYNNRVRSIEVKTGAVLTVVDPTDAAASRAPIDGRLIGPGIKNPRGLTFDRATGTPDSVLYVAAAFDIYRFERKSGRVERVALDAATTGGRAYTYAFTGLASLRNGYIIAACGNTHAVYAIDPASCTVERLAGSGQSGASYSDRDGLSLTEAGFRSPAALAVDENEKCVIIADSGNGMIRRATLSPHLFQPRT